MHDQTVLRFGSGKMDDAVRTFEAVWMLLTDIVQLRPHHIAAMCIRIHVLLT